jgi:hypothetical protein
MKLPVTASRSASYRTAHDEDSKDDKGAFKELLDEGVNTGEIKDVG